MRNVPRHCSQHGFIPELNIVDLSQPCELCENGDAPLLGVQFCVP